MARVYLPFGDWPAADRAAWEALFVEGDVLEDPGAAVHWAAATRDTNQRHFGRWLGWVRAEDALAFDLEPVARATQARVLAYGRALRDRGLAPNTVQSSLLGLTTVLAHMAPHHDWGWLRALNGRLKSWARPSVDRRDRHLPAAAVFATLLATLAATRPGPDATLEDILLWRDTLILAILTVIPIRLKNLAALRIADHLSRNGDEWRLDLDASETKAKRPHAAVLPPELAPHLEAWLDEIRPRLPGAAAHDGLWPSSQGARPLAYSSLYIRIMKRSTALFGVGINPHAFRTIAATFAAERAPDAPTLAATLLNHSDPHTTEVHYVRASRLDAGRTVAAILMNVRRDEETDT